ncbi:hypothetical protein [Streptomyces sp. NPDC057238]|uniref:hypothetical protein n=1 Tax=Streptomyces sp. NPDC057238 TaxID=3346060 RepID=UPI0036372AD1
MSGFPSGVTCVIGHALALNLRHCHQQFGADNLSASDLHVDVIAVLKWVHSVALEMTVHVARHVLLEVADEGDRTPGPLENAAPCLRHSLTRAGMPYGKWSQDPAKAFVTAALMDVR